jgi:hypothetical protein
MKLVDHASGQLVDVDEAQAPQALQSGKFGLPAGAPVRVADAEGTVGTVKPEETQALIAGGGRFASEDEYHKALLTNKYGGLGSEAASLGEGVARGATLGLSDPLAIGAARLFGGDKTAESVRTHLAEEKEAHPWLAGGGEVLGAAAPMLLSGGAAAAPELAGAAGAVGGLSDAGVMARIGEGVRTIGALPRGVGAAGDVAEHAVAGILGEGEGALSTAARSAAKAATRGIVEGGMFGAGQGISENSLADKPLVAENLLTYIGHGALTGGLLGGAVGGVGSLAKAGLGKLFEGSSDKLSEAAGQQTWKWLNPLKRYSDEATARAGGTDAVGRTVFDQVLKPLVEEKGLAAASMGTEQKLDLVRAAADRAGAQIGKLVEGNAHASVSLEDMIKPIQDKIDEFSGKVGGDDKVATMENLKASLIRVLGNGPESVAAQASPVVEAAPVMIKRTPDELRDYLRANPDVLQQMGNGSLPKSAEFRPANEAPGATPPSGSVEGASAAPTTSPPLSSSTQVPIGQAIEQRRALQQLAFQESKALDPKLRVQLLRDVSGAWGDAEVKALNAASDSEKGLAGDQLRALNKQFQHLTIAEKALETNVGRMATNNTFSLGDKIAGGAVMAGALAHGNPMAVIGSAGATAGSKMVREHGNAYSALLLDRLATWGGVSEATAHVDGQIDHAVDTAVSGATPTAGRRAKIFHTDTKDDNGRFDAEKERVQTLSQVAPAVLAGHLASQVAPMQTHAPQIASAVQQNAQKATSFLASKLPPQPVPSGMQPQLVKQGYSAAQKATFLRYVDAVEGGPPAILQRLGTGKLSAEDVETMKTIYPAQYAAIATKLHTKALASQKPIHLQRELQIAKFLGAPIAKQSRPDFLQVASSSYAAHGQQQQKQASTPRNSTGKLNYSKNLMGPFERAQSGD